MSSEETTNEVTQYLTFTLGKEDFALEIAKVNEVMDYLTITEVPRMPTYLKGVINLRGKVVPVIDLRLKLGMSAIQKTVDTCIVIVEIEMDGELMHMGALADSVKEVLDLAPNQIAPAPKMGTGISADFIKGMGKQDEKFLIILDIARILSSNEMAVVRSSTEDSTPESEQISVAAEEPLLVHG